MSNLSRQIREYNIKKQTQKKLVYNSRRCPLCHNNYSLKPYHTIEFYKVTEKRDKVLNREVKGTRCYSCGYMDIKSKIVDRYGNIYPG